MTSLNVSLIGILHLVVYYNMGVVDRNWDQDNMVNILAKQNTRRLVETSSKMVKEGLMSPPSVPQT